MRDTAHLGASRTDPALKNWQIRNHKAKDAVERDLPALEARSQDLQRNSGLASNAKRVSLNVLIGTGLRLSPAPRHKLIGMSSEAAGEWSDRTRLLFNDYAESLAIDSRRKTDFTGLIKLAYSSRYLSGSGILIPYWRNRSWTPYRTCFMPIDAERLQTPQDKKNDSRYVSGIEHSNDGEVVAYHFYNHEKRDYTRIPAFNKLGRRGVLYYSEMDRPEQSRGVPVATQVLAQLGLKEKYQLTEMQAAIVNSQVAGILKSTMTPQEVMETFGATAEEVGSLMKGVNGEMPNGGSILALAPGQDFQSHTPNRAPAAFTSFMEYLTREIGAGLGIPVERLNFDYSKSNYSSIKAALNESNDHFDAVREGFVEAIVNPMYELWLEDAIDLGLIEGTDFQLYRNAYSRAHWLNRGQKSIDPLKDEKANTEGLTNGNLTYRRLYERQGLDWEDEMQQRYREAAKMKELEEQYGVIPSGPKATKEQVIEENDEEI